MLSLCHGNLPFIVNRLDNESKGWADSVDVLAHDLLDDSRLARIVEPAGRPVRQCPWQAIQVGEALQHQYSEFFVLQPRFSQNRKHLDRDDAFRGGSDGVAVQCCAKEAVPRSLDGPDQVSRDVNVTTHGHHFLLSSDRARNIWLALDLIAISKVTRISQLGKPSPRRSEVARVCPAKSLLSSLRAGAM